jgi:PAS domain-containing protein
VQRWEREFALPIHRPVNQNSGIVVADTDEIDQWASFRNPAQLQSAAVTDRHSDDNHILQSIAHRDACSKTLSLLVSYIERTLNCDFAEILLVDGRKGRLLHVAGSNVPKPLIQSRVINTIGPLQGTAGAAAHGGKRVVSSCTRSDPKWSRLRTIATSHGIVSCWANPVLSSNGAVVAVVSAYFRRKKKPIMDNLVFLELSGRVAGLALQFNGLHETLESFEEKAGFLGVDSNFQIRASNKVACHLLGLSSSELMGATLWDLYPDAIGTDFHREYVKALQENIAVVLDDYYSPMATKFTAIAMPSNEGLTILFRESRSKRIPAVA